MGQSSHISTDTLHASCSQSPNPITHPSHTKHPLTLLPTPAYPGGSFYCDACGRQGDGFSYHCSDCEFDVHTTCASKPLSVSHHMHCHQLQMEFFPPYNAKGFSCDICRSTGANHWLYRCAYCEFNAHIDCATSSTQFQAQRLQQQHQGQTWQQQQLQAQPQVQQHAQTWPQQQPQVQAAQPQLQVPQNCPQSEGVNQYQSQNTAVANNNQPQGMMNYNMPNPTLGPVQNQQNGQPGQAANNSLTSQAHQSFVNAAADQDGQMLVQNFLGGGGNGGNGADGVGSSGDGSSTCSGIFGGGDGSGGDGDSH